MLSGIGDEREKSMLFLAVLTESAAVHSSSTRILLFILLFIAIVLLIVGMVVAILTWRNMRKM